MCDWYDSLAIAHLAVPAPACPPCPAAKGMLADLKEAAEKRKQERSTVLQAVSGRADFGARLQVGGAVGGERAAGQEAVDCCCRCCRFYNIAKQGVRAARLAWRSRPGVGHAQGCGNTHQTFPCCVRCAMLCVLCCACCAVLAAAGAHDL